MEKGICSFEIGPFSAECPIQTITIDACLRKIITFTLFQ